EVGSQGLVGLLAVPRTPFWGTQPGLHGNQLFKPLARTQLFHLGIGRLSRAFLGAFRLLFRVCGHRFIGCSPCESNVPLYGATARFTRRSGDLRWPAMLN